MIITRLVSIVVQQITWENDAKPYFEGVARVLFNK